MVSEFASPKSLSILAYFVPPCSKSTFPLFVAIAPLQFLRSNGSTSSNPCECYKVQANTLTIPLLFCFSRTDSMDDFCCRMARLLRISAEKRIYTNLNESKPSGQYNRLYAQIPIPVTYLQHSLFFEEDKEEASEVKEENSESGAETENEPINGVDSDVANETRSETVNEAESKLPEKKENDEQNSAETELSSDEKLGNPSDKQQEPLSEESKEPSESIDESKETPELISESKETPELINEPKEPNSGSSEATKSSLPESIPSLSFPSFFATSLGEMSHPFINLLSIPSISSSSSYLLSLFTEMNSKMDYRCVLLATSLSSSLVQTTFDFEGIKSKDEVMTSLVKSVCCIPSSVNYSEESSMTSTGRKKDDSSQLSLYDCIELKKTSSVLLTGSK